MAALFSAHVLGYLNDTEYRQRIGTTLRTLERMSLYDSVTFNKMYDARTARMVDRAGSGSANGFAWSATDLGRLLVWLSIVGLSDPTLRAQATRVVRRVNFSRVVVDGYVYGEDLGASGTRRRFQEGRIGYEQYAAHGFALWGQLVGNALNQRLNAEPLDVLGIPLLRDRRGLDRLTSEPFVLTGLEIGWTADEAWLARNILLAQERRFRTTGKVTMVSEDALQVKPYYFYYYCVYCSGHAFMIDVARPGKLLDSPRWISTKAAYAWDALLPSVYTRWAIQKVSNAVGSSAISTGVFEEGGASTHTQDLNTTAVVLESEAYRKLRRPLLYASVPDAVRR